jgi:hypothetical protein
MGQKVLQRRVVLDLTNTLSFAAVATVLGNWHNVLRAISMASSELFYLIQSSELTSIK